MQEGGRGLNVGPGRINDEGHQAHLGKEGGPDAGLGRLAFERDRGDAHPESFAGRGCAIVGKGVEAEIDLMVGFQMVLNGRAAGKEGYPLGVDR